MEKKPNDGYHKNWRKKSQKTPGCYIRPIYIGIYPEIETVPLRFASENRNVLYSTPGIIRSYVRSWSFEVRRNLSSNGPQLIMGCVFLTQDPMGRTKEVLAFTQSSSFVGNYIRLLPLLTSVFFVHASHRSPSLLSGTKVFPFSASSPPLEVVSSSHFCFSSQVLVLTVYNTVLFCSLKPCCY